MIYNFPFSSLYDVAVFIQFDRHLKNNQVRLLEPVRKGHTAVVKYLFEFYEQDNQYAIQKVWSRQVNQTIYCKLISLVILMFSCEMFRTEHHSKLQ